MWYTLRFQFSITSGVMDFLLIIWIPLYLLVS